ncbi:MAG: prolipoprotein diacylglyceryl transferase [Firmicutes bacterium]|mgnify:CR=1 FL=1|nr:prolipoprotein diacylglyceryl transferase [Bacillota bacterium]
MHPIAFSIGSIDIYWYGILMACAFASGYYIAHYFAKIHDVSAQAVDTLFFSSAVAAIVGGRLGVVVANLDYYLANPQDILARAGMASHGSLALVMLLGVLTVRKLKLSYWRIADIGAPIIPAAHVFVRLGNFLNGELYGPPTDLPWGIQFPHLPGPVHPTQLYEVAASLVILPLAWRWAKQPRYPGYAFLRVLLLQSLVRFFLDFIRQHSELIGPFVLSQIIALAICLVALPALFILEQRHR